MRHADYIRQLREAIKATHGCESRHVATSRVVSKFKGKTAWEGDVEVFDLTGHPKAKRCYAWGYVDNGQFRSTSVLEIPPVDSPSTAVDVAIAAKSKGYV
jgi:hypothetical protein